MLLCLPFYLFYFTKRGVCLISVVSLCLSLRQLIYGFFASSAARGLFINAMIEAGVLGAIMDDPLFALLRQASRNPQVWLVSLSLCHP